MRWLYLGFLVISILSMLLIDRRWSLVFFCNKAKAALTLTISVLVFIVWDVVGILAGVFFSGNSAYMSGLYFAPDFPVEELLFLFFLCYFTLIVYIAGERKC